ncbi:MAG: UDP-glucose 6-dehydrogenase [Candidatus Thorarchaeota archaeon]|nr:MAG: UDP-glucose 6-dehydrogenase [Candidatus Thorarchaeota archaeon]
MKITVYGAGYVGLTTAAVLSTHHDVTVIEIDERKVELINAGETPIAEPDLAPLLRDGISRGRLKAVGSDYKNSPQDAILICVNTPSSYDGSVDLKAVDSVMQSIETNFDGYVDDYVIIGMRSTVPPGTTRTYVIDRLQKQFDSTRFGVVFQPEFLRQGHAIYDLRYPDRVIIGASDQWVYNLYKDAILPCIKRENPPVIHMSIESAEMCKYASNSFLATKISFANEMASLAEKIPHVNIDDVMDGVVADHRICDSHLRPGLGFGGSCLPKDVSGLYHLGRQRELPMNLLESVQKVNRSTTDRLLSLVGIPLSELKGKKISILGMAFKADTDDIRDSPSIPLIQRLASYGGDIHVHDPVVNFKIVPNEIAQLFSVCDSIEDCTRDSYLAFLMTDWKEYRSIGLVKITENMREKYLVDGRRVFVNTEIPKNITYRAIGSSTISGIV